MADDHHFKFTQKAIEHLQPPQSGRETYWDLLLPGFGVRVSAPRRTGHVSKVFVCMYRVFGTGKQVFETIGKMTKITNVEDARERARKSMQKADAGVNPVDEKRRAKNAPETDTGTAPKKDPSRLIPAVFDWYIPEYRRRPKNNGKSRSKSTVEWTEGILNRIKNWQPYKIVDDAYLDDGENWSLRYFDDLTGDDVEAYLKAKGDEGFEVAANRALTVLKGVFKLALKEKIIAVNPIADLEKPYPEASRERWLSDAEIRAFWWACNQIGYPYGPIRQLLLLMAGRLNEVAQIPSNGELDLNARVLTIPAERTKTVTHLVYLTDLMMEVINDLPSFANSQYVFTGPQGGVASSFTDSKVKLDALMLDHLKREGHIAEDGTLKHWTNHDLRHTARTNFSRLRVDDHISERLLNHTIPGVRGIYDHWKYFDEKKEALERWSALVKTIISTK